MNLQRGQIFEFHSAVTGEIRAYELESAALDTGGHAGHARLRNLANDGIAGVLCKSLRTPGGWPSKSYWKRVEE